MSSGLQPFIFAMESRIAVGFLSTLKVANFSLNAFTTSGSVMFSANGKLFRSKSSGLSPRIAT